MVINYLEANFCQQFGDSKDVEENIIGKKRQKKKEKEVSAAKLIVCFINSCMQKISQPNRPSLNEL